MSSLKSGFSKLDRFNNLHSTFYLTVLANTQFIAIFVLYCFLMSSYSFPVGLVFQWFYCNGCFLSWCNKLKLFLLKGICFGIHNEHMKSPVTYAFKKGKLLPISFGLEHVIVLENVNDIAKWPTVVSCFSGNMHANNVVERWWRAHRSFHFEDSDKCTELFYHSTFNRGTKKQK